MPIDFSEPRPAYMQIAANLREQIKRGVYAPGDQLPSRKEIAAEYGVAPETVRKAQDELAREGLITSRSTRGTFVLKQPGEPEPSPEYMKLLGELERVTDQLGRLEARIGEIEGQLRQLRRASPEDPYDEQAD